MTPLAALLGRRRTPVAAVPPKPEWERIAEEIIDHRYPVGLDRAVFGDWPGTYLPGLADY